MSAPFLLKYGVASHVYVPMIKRGVVDFAIGADWTPVNGDVKASIDGGAAANIGTLPAAIAMGNTAYWDFTIAIGEVTGKKIKVTVADSATKAVEDQMFIIETYGHASAQYQADLSAANLPANVVQLLGTAWLAPGTAGTPDVNAKLIGGTAQTGGDIYPKIDTEVADIQSRLPAALTANGNMKSSLLEIIASTFTEGAVGRIAAAFKQFFNIAAPAATMDHLILVDTVTTYTGNTAQTGDSFARLGAPAGASHAADTAAVKADTAAIKLKTDNLPSDPADASDVAAAFATAAAAIAAVQADTDNIQTRLPAALTGAGNMKTDALAVNGSTNAAANLARGTLGVVLGTVGSASTTTSIVTSALDPAAAVADQYKGRIVTFDRATTTANLRGQATDITGNTAGGVLAVTALTDAPVSGDTFTIT